MTTLSENLSSEDLAALREEQAGKIQCMGHHEMAAYRAGFPPGERCIATPESYRTALENGEIEIAVSPLSLAILELDKLVGPQSLPNLGSSFGSSANLPVPENNTDLSSILTLERIV